MVNTRLNSNKPRGAVAIAVLLVLLTLPGASLFAGQVVVSSLPYTLSTHTASTWDTLTISGTRLSSASGVALTISVNYVYVKLDNDTIQFGTGNGSGAQGIRIYNSVHHVVIDGGYILHAPTGVLANDDADPAWSGSEPVANATAVRLAVGTHDIEIKNIRKAIVKGYADNAGSLVAGTITGGSYNIYIHNNDSLINSCYAFQQRDLFECPVYTMTSGMNSYPGALYNVRFSHNVCLDKAHTGLFLYRNSSSDPIVAWIDSNQITLDVRNNQYVDYGHMYQGCANAYAIQFTGAGNGTKIRGNRIRSGTRYLGGQGIHMVGSAGTGHRQIEVAYNNIETHQGFETEFSNIFHPVAVKLRQRLYGLWLHHDTIVYVTDTMRSVNVHGQAYAPQGHAIQVQQWDGAGVAQYVTIENCYIATRIVTDVSADIYATDVVNFEDWTGTPNPEMVWQYNKLYSEASSVYAWGQGGDGGASYLTVIGDTVSQRNGLFSAYQYTFMLATLVGTSPSTFNKARDTYFGANTSPTRIAFLHNGNPTASEEDITLQRTVHVYVKGSNNLPVVNASVTLRNAYGQTVLSGTSNSGGRLSGVVSYRFESRTATDSTAYNNFTSTAASGTDNASHSFAVNWNSYKDTVNLANTTGTGTWESGTGDVIPPDPIQDLGYVPGGPSTTATLTWHATGDDGSVGTAASYDLRRSTSPITISSFATATQISGEPTPRPSGQAETFTVTGLDSTVTYYFAIKAADEVPNWSDLSNVVSRPGVVIVVGDTTPPSPVTDLAVVLGSSRQEVVLSWSAPGDNGNVGTATTYDIRYSTTALNGANFASATQANGEPSPAAAGTLQSLTIGNLDSTATYRFAIKTADEVPNWSAISNVVTHTPEGDSTDPWAVGNLLVSTGTSDGTVVLSWTATGDDSLTGTADHYIVKYSTQGLDSANWGTATLATAPPTPLAPNSDQSMTLAGLTPGVIYYAGVVVVDEVGNQSALSNIDSAQSKITIVTGTEDTVVISEPAPYAVLHETEPSLVVENIDTNSANEYYFVVASDSLFIDIVASSGPVTQQSGGLTAWQVSPPLETSTDYYWRVKANDGPFGQFSTFTVDASTKAYPNPFRLSGGKQVKFAGIPSGSNLLLMTTSGETVRRWTDTDGSLISWDGKNETGQEVASGIYLWYVESSDIKGKLVVIR